MNMIEKRKAMAGQGGFTLIELLVVIAILAVLGGAAIIGISTMRSNAQQTACKSEKATIETALEARDVNTNTTGASTIANATTDGYLKKVTATDWTVTHAATTGYTVAPTATTGAKYATVTAAQCA